MRVITGALLLTGVALAEPLFNIKVQDLKSGNLDWNKFKAALATDGAFSVTGLSSEYLNAVQALSDVAPNCFKSQRLPKIILADGSVRSTYATNIENAYPDCILEAGSIINQEFSDVFNIVAGILEQAVGAERLSYKENDDGEERMFSSLQYKDHIHVYESVDSKQNEDLSLSFHTDSGVLLMLTPAPEVPLIVQNIHNELIDTSTTPANSIIFIIARGLPDWLLRGTPEAAEFFTAPHAVPSLKGRAITRTVFARMMVAPLQAIPSDFKTHKTQFQDIFLQRTVEKPGELCPLDLTTEDLAQDNNQCGDDPELALCWMSCLVLPDCNGDEKVVCTNLVGEACCSEYDSPDGCLDMDTTCEWKCEANILPF